MKYFALIVFAGHAFGWENHALLTKLAVREMPTLKGLVKAEALSDFLGAEREKIIQGLELEERWARQFVPYYPERADVRWQPGGFVEPFLRAIRVNPNAKLMLYLQELPGSPKLLSSDQYWKPGEITLLEKSLTRTGNKFVKVSAGDKVAALDVFVTATDEPDYGLDIGLWEDSNTNFGREYGFGRQPFGNPKLEFASQAPFHMGFYHEPEIMYWVAGDLARTLPEYRIHLYYSLAKLAFETGHDYWGWRFAGWGAHYIQDLTQPYHTTLFPSGSVLWMITAGFLDKLGFEDPKEEIVEQVSDGHLKLEEEVYQQCVRAYYGHEVRWLSSITQTMPERLRYTPDYVRSNLSAESYALSETLRKDRLMFNVGRHTRAWVRTLRESPL